MKVLTPEQVRQKHADYLEYKNLVNSLPLEDKLPPRAHLSILLEEWRSMVERYNEYVEFLKSPISN